MRLKTILSVSVFLLFITGCFRETHSTDWEYNNPHNGGFQKVPYFEQETAPDMVLIEGGAWPISIRGEESDSIICKTFYISKYEETNGQYLAYLHFLKRYYSQATYEQALPDTTIWNKEILPDAEKKYLVENYLRNPLYKDYPVVGVSAEQVKRYADWKTDRMNEFILIREGVLVYRESSDSNRVFKIESYLSDHYEPSEETSLVDQNPKSGWSGKRSGISQRIIRMEDGIIMPRFRLCTAHEWALAALAIPDSNSNYIKTSRETTFRKYDRENHFAFLKINPSKTKQKELAGIFPTLQKIGTVYSDAANNYSVYGLSAGVSELVQRDSLTFEIIGGSWNAPQYYHVFPPKVVEPKTKGRPTVYLIPPTVQNTKVDPEKPQGIYGFRLAMDRIGNPRR